ncbi:MAG: hypothetical protein EYC71_05460 [Gammaproteobacteria bacterium]|nr:MAG: hypothetical protein EYC71_05460 [Gammaproteobacteria bacterium]
MVIPPLRLEIEPASHQSDAAKVTTVTSGMGVVHATKKVALGQMEQPGSSTPVDTLEMPFRHMLSVKGSTQQSGERVAVMGKQGELPGLNSGLVQACDRAQPAGTKKPRSLAAFH